MKIGGLARAVDRGTVVLRLINPGVILKLDDLQIAVGKG